jgi:RNA polymerase sigma-70 factor (ECF subfamily)
METVAELVTAAVNAKHDHEVRNLGFEELVRRFQDIVFAYAVGMLRNVDAAQDVTQDAFLVAFQRIETLRTPAAFPGWLRRITQRCCLMETRKTAPEPMDPATLEGLSPGVYGVATPTPGAGASAPSSAHRQDSDEAVRAAIGELPENQRVSIVLYYIDGFSQQEIADFLDVQLSAVKKRLQRGRDAMRKKLEHQVRESLAKVKPSRSDELVETVSLYASFDMAAQLGQLCLLEAMLVDGIDVNQADPAGNTLLHWAVESDHTEAVEMLLKNGADPTAADRRGTTPLDLAVKGGKTVVLSILEAHR